MLTFHSPCHLPTPFGPATPGEASPALPVARCSQTRSCCSSGVPLPCTVLPFISWSLFWSQEPEVQSSLYYSYHRFWFLIICITVYFLYKPVVSLQCLFHLTFPTASSAVCYLLWILSAYLSIPVGWVGRHSYSSFFLFSHVFVSVDVVCYRSDFTK